MTRFRSIVFSLLASLLVACATGTGTGDAGPDAGTMPRDAGRDAPIGLDAQPPEDASDDAGPPDAGACPAGQARCEGECLDVTTDVMRCGSCDNDCTALPGVLGSRVRCLSRTCVLAGACSPGFGDCNGNPADGCESSILTPEHCGNCTVTCSAAAPFCSASSSGPYRCTTDCDGRTPDLCGEICTDVRVDPIHCGGCDRACPSGIEHTRPTCSAGVCGVACEMGYHECGGVCVSDTDPMACGTACVVCPPPEVGTATCIAGMCGVACDPGAIMCAGDCVDVLTSNAHCGGCGRACSGACVGGVCDTGVRLVLDAGADQSAYPDQLLPMAVVVRAHDAAMAPIAGALVTFTAPPGAVVTPASVTTDALGRATVVVRLGRRLGSYRFEAMNTLALGPVVVNATAIAPPSGTLFPIANVAHTSGSVGTPGPAIVATMGAVRGLAIASDGTVYVADSTFHVVRSISPEGEMAIVAGRSGILGVTGDGGPATMALLRVPSGLALDEAAGLLYIADNGNNRIRAVNLATGIISTIAGGGAATTAPFGDGGSATAATLSLPGHVRLGPDRGLYVADVGRNRIRRIDPVSGIITTWIDGGLATCTGAALSLYGCQSEPRTCDVVWDTSGRAFVSGYFCGTDIGTTTWGVVRREADGRLAHVAGRAAGLTSDGSPATRTLVNGAGSLALDPGGNLYIVENTSHRVRRIDGGNATIATIAGTGTAGYGSDHVAAMGQPLNVPWDLAFDGSRHLYVSESTNYVVRTMWELGASTPTNVRLELVDGSPQSIEVDRQVSTALSARLIEGASTPLVGVDIVFAPLDEGAGPLATSAATTPLGSAGLFVRPGLLPGLYRFEARYEDLRGLPVMGSPVTFSVTATAPPAGTIFTAVNTARVAGRVPGPATYARIGTPGGIAIAADGVVYIADRTQHVVWRLSPRGDLTIFAGTGTAGFLGDGGPATDARLNAPHGLALDAPNGILYVADRANNRIRSVDLTTRVIRTVAGGGSTLLAAPYGDDGPATNAYILSPGNVAVAPSGRVYISDTGHNRIRELDPVTGIITAWLGSALGCASVPVQLYGCASSAYQTCHVIFEADGSATISGQLCGNVAPLSTTAGYGIMRRDPDGTLTHLAGNRVGMTGDGVDARQALIGGAGWLARDASGALHYSDFGSHRVRRIDPSSGTVSTIAGTGVAGFSGEYVPSIAAQLSTPWGIGFHAGHLFLADGANVTLRVIW